MKQLAILKWIGLKVTAERIENLFNSQYVPFVSEVEEFNSLMNKPNNYVPTIPAKRMGLCLQLRFGRT
jgi:hypothetical protein